MKSEELHWMRDEIVKVVFIKASQSSEIFSRAFRRTRVGVGGAHRAKKESRAMNSKVDQRAHRVS